MADVDWPSDLARIVRAGYTADPAANNYRRTPFQDGFVEQKKISGHPAQVRRFQVLVADDHKASFLTWVSTHGGAPFNFTDYLTGETGEWRIMGGNVQLVAADDGERLIVGGEYKRFWRGQVELEGYV